MNQGYAYKVITKLAGMETDTDLLYKNQDERVLILQQGKIFFQNAYNYVNFASFLIMQITNTHLEYVPCKMYICTQIRYLNSTVGIKPETK